MHPWVWTARDAGASLFSHWKTVLIKFGTTYSREPGILVHRAVADDKLSSMFEIVFWKQFKTYAAVSIES